MSAKSSTSIKSIKTLRSLELSNVKLRKCIEDENRYHIVLSIREEIIESAFEEVYNRYLDVQTVKFTVHCACQALEKILELYFYRFDPGQPYYENHPVWSEDKPPEPSVIDSWAAHRAAVKAKADVPEVTLSEFEPFPEEADELEAHSSETETVSYRAEGISDASDLLTLESLPTAEAGDQEVRKYSSLVSLFTSIKTGRRNLLPLTVGREKSRKKLKGFVSRIPPPKPCPQNSAREFSPLRVAPKFSEQQEDEDAQKKKKKR